MALVKASTVRAKRFYRQTFEMKKDGTGSVMLHTLIINPEDMSMEEPARATVTQTLGGAFVTDFGQGLPQVSISGATGYKKRINAEGYETDGYEEFKNFRQKVYRDFISTNDPDLHLYWYNWEDDEYYEIQPTSFRLQRNKSEPLLYRYELRFTCLRKLKNSKNSATDTLKEPSVTGIGTAFGKAISAISEFLGMLK